MFEHKIATAHKSEEILNKEMAVVGCLGQCLYPPLGCPLSHQGVQHQDYLWPSKLWSSAVMWTIFNSLF